MSVMVDSVALAWAMATLLLLLALWRPAAGVGRRHRHAAMAGALILTGAALYGADIINLPEIAGALVIGAAIGLLLARELPGRLMLRLMIALAGSTGLAMACAALAVRRNPYAFGLLGEGSARIAPWQGSALVIALLAGLMAVGVAAARSTRNGVGLSAGLSGPIALLAGGSFALFAGSERAIWLAAGIVPSLLAGGLLGGHARRGGEAASLAATAGLAGLSAAAIAFLLDNMGLVVAGGLATSAGGLLVLRLCGGSGGKGLADARRHA